VPSDPARLPLSALLSAALVAFTIEFDNAAELQTPHQTTRHGSARGGVWLVSMVMWLNCLRYAGAEPVTAGELARLARTTTNLDGMRRWGYITLSSDPADTRATPPWPAMLVTATARSGRARQVWEPLTAVIEDRWRDRFGAQHVARLMAALRQIAGQLPGSLPDCLPILGHGLYSGGKARGGRPAAPRAAVAAGDEVGALALPWLLARALLAIALEFEDASPLSLAISANLLRVLDQRGVRVRDLPLLSGVSKESLAMATGFTGKRGLTVIEPAAEGTWKVARLTAQGERARQDYADRIAAIEAGWQQRFGDQSLAALRDALEPMVARAGPQSPLRAGLVPEAGNWRASIRQAAVLPHFPMVLHRGGYPDGS
jgi:hypothetical protein